MTQPPPPKKTIVLIDSDPTTRDGIAASVAANFPEAHVIQMELKDALRYLREMPATYDAVVLGAAANDTLADVSLRADSVNSAKNGIPLYIFMADCPDEEGVLARADVDGIVNKPDCDALVAALKTKLGN
jgi:hypothetical protein